MWLVRGAAIFCPPIVEFAVTYQVLARKWRPQNFSDLVGQEHVVKALINALESGRLHHAYLFTGTRGVGKTTIARIFAKSLNCENGVSAEPCGTCSICQDIMAGRFFDLIEVDAASNTGVDDTRELLENAQYKPTSGRYKVYLIDEVHMFSKSSFNALLKTLEEPPEHVKFLLATTEQKQLPATVLSRCLQFNLKSMPQSLLAEHLATILKAEKIEFEPRALAQVAKVADGSVRDSLSLVEQVAALGEGAVKSSIVENLLGVLSTERVLDLVRCISEGDSAKSMALVATLAEFSPDYSQLLADMLSILHHMAMQQMVPGAASVTPDWPVDAITEASESLSPEDVQLFYQIALQGQRDMPFAPRPRESFEMTVLRMLHFRPVAAGSTSGSGTEDTGEGKNRGAESATGNTLREGLAPGEISAQSESTHGSADEVREAIDTAVSGPDSGNKSSTLEAEVSVQKLQPSAGVILTSTNVSRVDVSEDSSIEKHAADSQSQKQQSASQQFGAQVSPAQISASRLVTEEPTGASVPEESVLSPNARSVHPHNELPPAGLPTPKTWNQFVDQLAVNGAGMQLARNSSLISIEQQNDRQSITLCIAHSHEELKVDRDCQRLEKALGDACQQPVTLLFSTGEHRQETVAQRDERLNMEAQRAAEASIAADPIVKTLLERVDGELEKASIQPVAPVSG